MAEMDQDEDKFDFGSPLNTYKVAGPIDRGSSSPTCRLWLPSDALYALRCSPGTLKLVALQGSERSLPTSLTAQFNKTFKLDLEIHEQVPGDYLVAAQLWPSTKLRPGTAALSDPLYWALGAPASDTSLAVYDIPGDISTLESTSNGSDVCLQMHCAVSADSITTTQLPPLQPRASPMDQSKPTPGTPVASPGQKAHGRRASMHATPPSMRSSPAGGISSPAMMLSQERQAKTPSSLAEEPAAVVDMNGHSAKAIRSALLGTSGQVEGKVLSVMQYLAFQAFQDRHVLEGNLLRLPFLGLDVVLRVGDAGTAGKAIPVRVASSSDISIVQWSGEGVSNSLQKLKSPSAGPDAYAHKAAQAAAEALGGGEDGPAAQAAFQAARSGEGSFGTSFDDLGGLKPQMEALRRSVTTPLRHFTTFTAYNLSPPSGVLLHGPPGTGKTALARAAAAAAQASFFVLNGPDVVAEHLGESEMCIRGIFAGARALSPSIIFIDEIDALAPSRGGGGQGSPSPVSARLVTTLLTELDSLRGHPVVVLAATNRIEALDESLRRPGRLDKELEVGVPSPADRRDILRKMLQSMRHSLTEDEITTLAEDAHGYVGADLSALCSEAAMSALRQALLSTSREAAYTSIDDFMHARGLVRPSALREVALQPAKVRWSDVGGNDDIKQQLKEVVEWPTQCQASLARLGATPPTGVLLYGPPGCSKTLLAKAVAREANMNFLAVKGPELLSKYVGESEKALRNLFHRARAASPSVIFFDEIDGLIGTRSLDGTSHGGGGVDVGERVLSQLLQEMDGLQNSERRLIVMAATNRPDCLDPALLRPGRFDRLLFVPPPDCTSRADIFKIHTRKIPLEYGVEVTDLAARTDGYTGADIASVCQQAAVAALEEDIEAESVGMEHFLQALRTVGPSALGVSDAASSMYDSFRRQVA